MNTQKRMKLLQKLAAAGFKDEAAIQKIDLDKALDMEGITIEELREIKALKAACKNNRVLGWLNGETGNKTQQEL